MDDLDRLDGPDRPEGFDGPDGRDLELVARLWTEPPDDDTTARHHRQLVAAIQATSTPSDNGAAPPPSPMAHDDDSDRGEEAPVVELNPLPSMGGGHRRHRRRLVATAAAVIVIAGGLLTVNRWASDGDDSTETGQPPAEEPPPCDTELPFTFPVPAGFDGPFPGPSGEASDPYGPTDALKLHWRSGQVTIDVRWPTSLPMDPTTPTPGGETHRMRYPAEFTGDGSLLETFYSQALGTGDCTGLDVNVASPDPGANETVLAQIDMALVGPGGPLAPQSPLVTGSTTADTLPSLADWDCEGPDNRGGPVEGGATHPTPHDALGFFVATDHVLSQHGYQEIVLPDGSYGYAHHFGPDVTTVVHVVPSDAGWRVASWATKPC